MTLKYKVLIGAVIGLFVIAVGLALLFSKKNDDNPATYNDPFSHETISSPPGKSPDTFGNQDQLVILGIDKLMNQGLSQYQSDDLKEAFKRFSDKNKLDIKEVSVDVDHIKVVPFDSSSSDPKTTLLFDVQINRRIIYHSKIEFSDISSLRLYLYNQENNLIYDSGVIDNSKTID